MTVKLTPSEMYFGAQVGIRRHIQELTKGTANSQIKNAWNIDVNGALAEMVVAKAMGVFWDASSSAPAKGDVGNIEVRSTEYKTGHLRISPKDDDHSIFVLVTGMAPNYVIRGWIYGFEAKQEKYFRQLGKGGKKQYYVPQDELHPIEDLKQHFEQIRQSLFFYDDAKQL